MTCLHLIPSRTTALRAAALLACSLAAPAFALTGIQVGPSGKTYASADLQCAMHPSLGLSPMVQAGLYNPKKNARGTVALIGTAVATVTLLSPDAPVWLANGANQVTVTLSRSVTDRYAFDASPDFPGQPNVCIPDTAGNTVGGDLETAASGKSGATVTPGCAFHALTGRAQPYVHLFDNGAWLLNVSVNNVPLTQLDGRTRTHVPVFLAAGLNVISAANGSLSTDFFVRHGGTGSCALP